MEKSLRLSKNAAIGTGINSKNISAKKYRFAFAVLLLAYLFCGIAPQAMAQTPAISYNGPQVYSVSNAITQLAPASSSNVSPVSYAAAATYYSYTGLNPYGLVADANGNIFVGNGTEVDVITPGGVSSTVASGYSFVSCLAVDAAGNLYVCNNSAIIKITQPTQPSPTSTTIVANANGPTSMAIDAAGDIFVGGQDGLKEYAIAGGVVSTTATVVLHSSDASYINGLAFDKTGNLYMAWSNSTTLEELPASITSYPVTTAQFVTINTNIANYLTDVAADNAGNIFVCGYNTIDKIDPSGNITTITSAVAHNVALDPSGNVYFVNTNNSIGVISQNGGYYISPVLPAGLTFDEGAGTINGTPTATSAATNYTITGYNTSGTKGTGTVSIAVVDTRLAGLSITGTLDQTFAPGTLAYTGSANEANFSITPTGIDPAAIITINGVPVSSGVASVQVLATGPNNFNIAVTNGTNITHYNLTVTGIAGPNISYTSPPVFNVGTAITSFGPATSSNVDAFGYGTQLTYSNVAAKGLTTDAAGNLYYVQGPFVYKIPAGGGAPVTIATDFFNLYGIAIDPSGNIYVSDIQTNSIYKINNPGPSSTSTTMVSGLSTPLSIATDAAGNLYVVEIGASTHDLKEYVITGGVAGPATVISNGFGGPTGVAIDKLGNIYVADSSYGNLFEIPAGSTYPISTNNMVSLGSGLNAAGATAGAVAVDNLGNLYVAEQTGSTANFNTVLKIAAGNGAITTVNTGGLQSLEDIAIDGSGNIYYDDVTGSVIYQLKQTGGYYINPALPAGLSFDVNTGAVSGTPTATSPASNYTVAAHGNGQKGTAALSLAVVDSRMASLTITGTLNQTFAPGTLTYTGTAGLTNFSITPTTSDPAATITINGVPVSSAVATTQVLAQGSNLFNIVVTASNGVTTTNYALTVTGVGPAAISYTSPHLYSTSAAITPLAPSPSNNVAPFAYGTPTAYYTTDGPQGMATDAAGNLYVVLFDALTEIPAGGGTPVTICTGFTTANAIAIDASGHIYVTDEALGTVSTIVNPGPSGTPSTLISGLKTPVGIATDAAGSVYVLENNGGANRDLKKYVITGGVAGAAITVTSGLLTPQGVAIDATGNIYIADEGQTILLKIPAGSTFPIAVANMVTIGSGFSDPNNVAIDNAGNLFVSDQNNNAVKRIAASNSAITTINGAPTQYLDGIAVDGSGNVYYSTYTGNYSSNSVYQLPQTGGYTISPALPGLSFDNTTGTISGTPAFSSPATNYTVTAYGQDGHPATATVNIQTVNVNLSNLAISTGTLSPVFAAGTNNYTVTVPSTVTSVNITPTPADITSTVNISSPAITTGNSSTNFPITTGSNPITITVTAADGVTQNIYTVTVNTVVAPAISYTGPQIYNVGTAIASLIPIASNIDTYAYNSSKTLIASTTATSTSQAIGNSTGVAVYNGNVYLVSFTTSSPASIYQVPTGAVSSYGSNLTEPYNIASDGAGNLYVADELGGAVQKINIATNTQTLVASGITAPTGVAVDGAGNVYVADIGTKTIIKIANGVKTTYAKSFSSPYGLALDAAGDLYVADEGGSAIYEIPAGTTTDPSASSLTKVTATLSGASAISKPTSIAFDGAGNLYVANSTSGKLIEISNTGVTTLLASGFTQLFGVAVDGKGNVYATDDSGQAAYQISPVGGYFISPALPAGLVFDNNSGTISGTPTIGSPATNYTITGYNVIGQNTSTTLSIQTVSSNANLSALTLGTGTISPAFAPATLTGYTASVTAASVTLTPVAADPSSTIMINGQAATSNMPFNLALVTGSNPVTVTVTANDGVTIQNYTLNITRTVGLTGLTLSAGTLNPAFSGTGTTYTASVAVSSITVTPTSPDATYTITIGSTATPATSGVASAPINLTPGLNAIPVTVTAAGGTSSQTYTINVTYIPSTVSTLSKLLVNAASQSLPSRNGVAFNALSLSTNNITFTPTTSDATATVAIGVGSSPTAFTPVTSATASAAYTLTSGANPFTIKVTAASGATTSYTITLNYTPSATLSTLTVNSGVLSFSSNTVNYSITSNSPTFSITPTTTDAGATLTVSGTTLASGPIASGTATTPITLVMGTPQTITVVVTPVSGTAKTYTLTVNYALSTTSSLSALSIASPSGLRNFRSNSLNYTATAVASNISSISITPTVTDPTSVVTIANTTANNTFTSSTPVTTASGSALSVPVIEGTNTITVLVTAQDGTHITSYLITVNRALSSNSLLSALTVNNSALNPVFDPVTVSYAVSLPANATSLTLTPTPADAQAVVKVNGVTLTTPAFTSSISLGTTNYTVLVTSPDGTSNTSYTVAVTVPNNTLDKLGLTSTTTAVGGYSLRLLSSTYAGPLARITIGSNYYDVYPDASSGNIFSLSSPISGAYTNYNGPKTGATSNLLSSVVTGSTTATVDIWYNQTGNGYDAIQANTPTQPEIISGGVVDVTNGLPTVKFLGSNWLIVTSLVFNNDLSGSVVFDATSGNTTSGAGGTWYTMNGIFGSEQNGGVNDFGYGVYNDQFTAGNGPGDTGIGSNTPVTYGTLGINSWARNNTTGAIALYTAGLADGSATLNAGSRNSVPSVAIGAITTNGQGNFFGTLSELTLFPIVYTDAQRRTVEGNQATYYNTAYSFPTTIALVAATPKTTNATSVNYTVTFTKAITGLTAANFTLTDPALSSTSVGNPSTNDGGFTWTVPVNTGTGDGALTLNVDNATGITPSITNILPFAGDTITIDKTAPVLSNVVITTSNTNPAVASLGDVVTLTFTASEPLQSIPSFTIAGATEQATNTGGNNYSVSHTMITGDVLGAVEFKANVTDLVGNTFNFDQTSTIIFSITEPTTVTGVTRKDPNPTNAATVNYTVTFANAVTGLTTANFTVTTDPTISGPSVSSVTNNGDGSYNVAVATGTGDGNIVLSLNNANNLSLPISTALPFAGDTYTINKTAPVISNVVITTSNANPAIARLFDVVTLTFTTSEPLQSNFTFTIAGATEHAINTSGNNYIVTHIMHLGDVLGAIEFQANMADLAGNTFNFDQTSTIIFSIADPTQVTGITRKDPNPTNAATVNYTVTFANAVTGLTATNFTVTADPTINEASVGSVTNNGDGSYNVAVATGTGDGNIVLNLDNANNLSVPVTTTLPFAGDTYTIDKTAPATSSLSFASNNVNIAIANISDQVTLTVITSEAVQTPSVTIAGHAVTPSLTNTSGSNYTYSAAYTLLGSDVADGNGNVPFVLNLTDLAGNTANYTELTTGKDVEFENSPGLTTGNSPLPLTTVLGTPSVSTSFTVSGVNLSENVLATASAGFEVSTDNTNFSQTITLTASSAAKTIYLRLAATATEGTHSGNITLSSAGVSAVVVLVNGTVTSTNAKLSALTLSAGTLSPVFDPATTIYTTIVSPTLRAITLTPVTDDPAATVLVNGLAANQPVTINTNGTTVINVTVTASDGLTSKIYTLTVSRGSDVATAAFKLSPSASLIEGSGTAAETDFSASVAPGTASVMLTPTATDPNATITVNGVAVASGTASGTITLGSGPTLITAVVTAVDGKVKTYNITVNKNGSNLATATFVLNPSAALVSTLNTAAETDYTATVAAGTASITLTPTATDPNATIKVNGITVASGTASAPIILGGSPTLITTVVTAVDGTVKTYGITISKNGSSVATASIQLNPSVTLVKGLSTIAETDYSASVAPGTASVTLTPTATYPDAIITVNGLTVASGTASAPIALGSSPTTITTIVAAGDGTTVKTYVVTVSKNGSSIATANLQLSPASTLVPTVSTAAETDYTTSVASGTATVTLTPTATDPNATIKVNGVTVASGTASLPISLGSSPTTITTIVTAVDGTTKKYLVVISKNGSSIATAALLLSPYATLVPALSTAAETDYTASIAPGTASVTLTPTATDPNATIKVNGVTVASGTASLPISLGNSPTTITAIVTAVDGTTKKYLVVVSKNGSSIATAALLLSPYATLVPALSTAAETDYTASVAPGTATVTLTPTATDPNATITVNGVTVASGTASGAIALGSSPTLITTVVTAVDGTVKTYGITINKNGSSIATATFKLSPSASLIEGPATTAETDYSASVAPGTASVTLTPTATDPNATITVDGVTLASGTASGVITLGSGPTLITTVVTAVDGTVKTYNITVSANGSNLATATFKLSPSATLVSTLSTLAETDYTATVAAGTGSITLTPTATDPNAAITVDGVTIASGTASGAITLGSSPTLITVVITAVDGTVKTYGITVSKSTVAPDNGMYTPALASITPAAADQVLVHQAVSPNGDGVNDYLKIDGIEAYPDNRLVIMNATGNMVFTTSGYDNITRVFDGHSSKGAMQLAGTYFYELQYKVNGKTKSKTGFIILKY
jgi:gliding motility-associated-like protein